MARKVLHAGISLVVALAVPLMVPSVARAAITSTTISGAVNPLAIDVDSAGNIWIGCKDGCRPPTDPPDSRNVQGVYVIPVTDSVLFGVTVAAGVQTKLFELANPQGILRSPAGHLFVATESGSLYVATATNTTVFGVNTTANQLTPLTGFAGSKVTTGHFMGGLAMDSAGNLFGGRLYQGRGVALLPVAGGTLFGQATVADTSQVLVDNPAFGLDYTGDVAIDSQDNLYIGSWFGTQGVFVLPKTDQTLYGVEVEENVLERLVADAWVAGIDIDGADNIYFAQWGIQRINVLSPANRTLLGQAFTANTRAVLAGSSGLADQGLAVSHDGTFVVSGARGPRNTVRIAAAPPTITSVLPSSGPAGGGTSVTITGSALDGASAVTFGGAAASSVVVVSSTTVTATAPPGAGTVDVQVTTPGGTATAAGAFTYVVPPTVTSIAPAAGVTAGSTPITIAGTGFVAGASVTIGGQPATSVNVVSQVEMTAVTPPGLAGAADVVVTTAGGAATAAGAFTYAVAPTVTSISPAAGATFGSAPVTITGTGFVAGASVTIGGQPATSVNVVSQSTITAVTPPGLAGAADVVVTNPIGLAGTLGGGFTYVSPAPPPDPEPPLPPPTPSPTPSPSPTPTPAPTPTPTPTPIPTPSTSPEPVPSVLPPGDALGQVDGQPVPVQVEPNPGDRGLRVQAEGWELSLEGLGRGGRPLELGPQGALVVETGRETALAGSGFAPGSQVGVFLDPPMSQARVAGTVELGDLTVGPQGRFNGILPVPRTVPPGTHVLQIVGTGPRGERRVLSLGVSVAAWIDLVGGQRVDAGRYDRVTATGATSGLPAGATLTVWVRLSGKDTFHRGATSIIVGPDGTFTWTRLVKKDKGIAVHVSYAGTDSNRVTWVPSA